MSSDHDRDLAQLVELFVHHRAAGVPGARALGVGGAMNQRLDTSFLEGALDFASRETRHWVADALACHLHNTGYTLDGNREANDVEWFARALWQAEVNGTPHQWETGSQETKDGYRRTARTVIRVLPDYQLRVAHRLIDLSKVVRDIERSLRERSGLT